MCNTLITESDVTSSMMGEMYRLLASAQLRGRLYKTGYRRTKASPKEVQMSGTNSMAELDACPMHQRGTCTSVPVIYKVLPHTCTALALQLVQHQPSNKRLTITPSYNNIPLLFFEWS